MIELGHARHVEIDDAGRARSYGRGTYGTVVRVESPEGPLALKLPTLGSGDDATDAATVGVVEKERADVARLLPPGEDWSVARGLVPVRRALDAFAAQRARDGSRRALLASFEAKGAPRLCAVRWGADGVRVEPPLVSLSPPELEAIARASHDWTRPAVVRRGEARRVAVASLDAVVAGPPSERWYAALPSIGYAWADGTLAGASRAGALRGWGAREHLAVAGRLLEGLGALHERGLVHGDVRVDHVMHLGDPAAPEAFGLVEYATISAAGAFPLDGAREGADASALALVAARDSPSYPPCRRRARCLEGLEIALSLGSAEWSSGRALVVLGPRERLLAGGAVRSGVVAEVRAAASRMSGRGSALAAVGSRLRLDDVVLDVFDATSVDGVHVVLVGSRCGLVERERFVRRAPLAALPRVLPVGRATRLGRWDSAGDVYGVGVVLLYTLAACEGPPDPIALEALLEAASQHALTTPRGPCRWALDHALAGAMLRAVGGSAEVLLACVELAVRWMSRASERAPRTEGDASALARAELARALRAL